MKGTAGAGAGVVSGVLMLFILPYRAGESAAEDNGSAA